MVHTTFLVECLHSTRVSIFSRRAHGFCTHYLEVGGGCRSETSSVDFYLIVKNF